MVSGGILKKECFFKTIEFHAVGDFHFQNFDRIFHNLFNQTQKNANFIKTSEQIKQQLN